MLSLVITRKSDNQVIGEIEISNIEEDSKEPICIKLEYVTDDIEFVMEHE